MTSNKTSLSNLQTTSGSKATMGNGSVEETTAIGDLHSTICDQHGNLLDDVVVQDISIILNLSFNLFSITKMLKNGWLLGGSKTSLSLSKGWHKIVFDIVIKISICDIHDT